MVSRRVLESIVHIKDSGNNFNGGWNTFIGDDIQGKTIGIFGLGGIGNISLQVEILISHRKIVCKKIDRL